MDGVVVKAKRQQRGRTRAGCATCRLRRVKCDETKPRCNRCVKADRLCDWEVVKAFKFIDAIALSQNGTSPERRGLDFFTKCTAQSLSGLFPSEFWQRNIIQAGTALPSLRHAIIAIGAVHEQFLIGTVADESFALKQYTLSLSELQKDMVNGECTPEVALICCSLYIAFDSLRGMTSSAIMHLENGVRILQNMQNAPETSIVGSHKDLRRLMSRLASQINSDMGDPSDPGADREDTINALADIFGRLLQMHPLEPAVTFSSLEEARDHLYSFINAHLYHYYLRSLYYGCDNAGHLQEHIESLQQPILDALQSWSSAFESFLQRHSPTMTAPQASAASLLQMHFQVMHVLIIGQLIPDEYGQTSLNTKEVFRPYDINFGEALMLIEKLMISSTTSKHPEFYMDVAVVPMLFFIAMKCTDKRLRKRATELLRLSKRREGTWDSETCLRIVEYAIATEETRANEESMERLSITEVYEISESWNSPASSGSVCGSESTSVTSPDRAIDIGVVLQDEKARRYIEAGKEEARRLMKRSRGDVKHSLLYL